MFNFIFIFLKMLIEHHPTMLCINKKFSYLPKKHIKLIHNSRYNNSCNLFLIYNINFFCYIMSLLLFTAQRSKKNKNLFVILEIIKIIRIYYMNPNKNNESNKLLMQSSS
ncbi:hypothetical protein EDEG_00246 [Edhazardia aedis USNM 41457]|uniref:Uncharacterized protein n=1 Tax=Edhazardia aedis (strain USNM 41457) TaxID=1003232 RepID=J9DNY2_EDHAE|nr:hypothetical protein EDEG_00246 [Edhazardia aedis USNM 41457]|eukprot:EJW03052.1 hypothetical protein EDEG_00246 [Edhazardia aedis USNM 41457]